MKEMHMTYKIQKKSLEKIFYKVYRYCSISKKKINYFIFDLFNNNDKCIRIDWVSGTNNFGDIINPILINQLTGLKISQVSSKLYYKNHYFIIGSIVGRANKYTNIWGSGFISEDDICTENPKKIFAVRGPKTRERLLNIGIECPEVYGDPALLLPQIYNPKIKIKYKLGLIPHYVDKENLWLKNGFENQNIIIIDVQEKNPLNVVNKILSCEKIASSSLHGIIVADAYNIPSLWIEFSNKVAGNGFKFLDYFQSVGRNDDTPFRITKDTKINDILEQFYEYKIDINLELLLNSAPFKISIK